LLADGIRKKAKLANSDSVTDPIRVDLRSEADGIPPSAGGCDPTQLLFSYPSDFEIEISWRPAYRLRSKALSACRHSL
jgi:hypothetical protein